MSNSKEQEEFITYLNETDPHVLIMDALHLMAHSDNELLPESQRQELTTFALVIEKTAEERRAIKTWEKLKDPDQEWTVTEAQRAQMERYIEGKKRQVLETGHGG